MRRVVITGVGLATPMGSTLAEFRERYERAQGCVRLFPGGPEGKPRAAGFLDGDQAEGFGGNIVKIVDRTVLLALKASDAALADAGLAAGSFDATRFGTFVGNGCGPTVSNHALHEQLFRKDHVSPMAILKELPNAPAGHVSMRHGLKGECALHSVACASAGAALGHALRMIRHGYLDMAIAGGAEAPLGESTFRGWEAMRILARVDPADPAASCRPFAKGRSGIVLGEGAALFILESEDGARARGARILATVAGYGASADAGHITLPSQEGQSAAMRYALQDANLQPGDIHYINAHGTATEQGDAIETRSVREVFGAHADTIPMSSTKSFHGHLLGASAAIELLASIVALNDGVIAPTLNVDVPDPACDLDVVPNKARTGVAVRAAMNNNFAFGGSNASMILTR
ncbi:MAG TPA: beta-ketoacyl-[acyl-carrier-protein] synthase family protein [Burkholderiaceae bacterium]|jgi:3-oxoacyl-[acyl-carrier-protein] synthase II|nr:beta-ketoacyl-[acyl-carrier-protein] synthase family protein [Burkholderiaceae bacterium]